MGEQSNRPCWQTAAVQAAAQSRPADEKEAALGEEHNRPAAVVLEEGQEEVQSLLLAVDQEAVQQGGRSRRTVYSGGGAVDSDILAAALNTDSSDLSLHRHNSAPASQEDRCSSHSGCQNTWLMLCFGYQAIEFTAPCCFLCSRLTHYIRRRKGIVL